MKIPAKGAVAALLAAPMLVGAAIVATAQSTSLAPVPDANGVIHACYDSKDSDPQPHFLRMTKCGKKETKISWNALGAFGVAGTDGANGRDGVDGDYGGDGTNGLDGTNGFDGKAGKAGKTGQDGAKGIDGETGNDGTNGMDGETGPQGPAGETGTPGPMGPMGPAGETGTSGPMGPAGPTGKTGPAGATGPTGPAGENSDLYYYSIKKSIVINNGELGELTADCPTGALVVGGGFDLKRSGGLYDNKIPYKTLVYRNLPWGGGWQVGAWNNEDFGDKVKVTAFAVCLKGPSPG